MVSFLRGNYDDTIIFTNSSENDLPSVSRLADAATAAAAATIGVTEAEAVAVAVEFRRRGDPEWRSVKPHVERPA
ncbi:hypothetical protein E2C01_094969 [Portunus trituberculatus]|uniref:Uncharacterized protein n=1 Tax=Portunus trituberculatus TaxID=210409 RepID=A0A5B7K333_PORTR|nr:hypothetical protein [Portunus trituberculatus]